MNVKNVNVPVNVAASVNSTVDGANSSNAFPIKVLYMNILLG